MPSSRTRARVYAADLFKLLAGQPDREYGLVFIDPPYGKGLLVPALELALGRGWIAEDAFVLAEVEAGLDIDPKAVHVELELLADKLYGQTRILIWTRTAA